MSNQGRHPAEHAAAPTEREQVCTTTSGFEHALTNGDVSAGHLDAIATATKHLDDDARAEFIDQADSLLGVDCSPNLGR